jgi:hypothetical protein
MQSNSLLYDQLQVMKLHNYSKGFSAVLNNPTISRQLQLELSKNMYQAQRSRGFPDSSRVDQLQLVHNTSLMSHCALYIKSKKLKINLQAMTDEHCQLMYSTF